MVAILITIVMLGIVGYVVFAISSMSRAKNKAEEKTKENKKGNYYDELLELQKLKEKNILTAEEFEKEKEKAKKKVTSLNHSFKKNFSIKIVMIIAVIIVISILIFTVIQIKQGTTIKNDIMYLIENYVGTLNGNDVKHLMTNINVINICHNKGIKVTLDGEENSSQKVYDIINEGLIYSVSLQKVDNGEIIQVDIIENK